MRKKIENISSIGRSGNLPEMEEVLELRISVTIKILPFYKRFRQFQEPLKIYSEMAVLNIRCIPFTLFVTQDAVKMLSF
jgi:hypothetical protein